MHTRPLQHGITMIAVALAAAACGSDSQQNGDDGGQGGTVSGGTAQGGNGSGGTAQGGSSSGQGGAGGQLQPIEDPTWGAAFVWRGMRHEWLRNVLGFRVPHRISKLASLVDDEAHQLDGDDIWGAYAQFQFGQSTGVDGNYMVPQGQYSAFFAPALSVYNDEFTVTWTDDADENQYPQADSLLERELLVPLTPNTSAQAYGAYLRGISLDVQCDDAKQPPGNPCNSNGMWPHRFNVAIGACTVDGEGEERTMRCPLTIDIGRSWTPNLGGLPPFETKPFNDRLDFSFTVKFTAIHGPTEALKFSRMDLPQAQGMARDNEPISTTAVISGTPNQFPIATSAMTAFGFELFKTEGAAKHNHLGRYIGALQFQLEDLAYSANSGELSVTTTSQLWVPDTVAQSGVRYNMSAAAIQLGDGAATSTSQLVSGSLCSNSSSQAPGFSKWEKCGTGDKGPEAAEHSIPIAAP